MDSMALRKLFAELAGAERLDRFMHQLHHNPKCRRELLYWQEMLWEDFRSQFQLEEMEHSRILELFRYCHRHEKELATGHPGEVKSYYDEHGETSSHFYREAYRRVEARYFPFADYREIDPDSFATDAPWHCTCCCAEKKLYVNGAHHEDLSLADYPKLVCDIEQQIVAIYDELGEESEVGRLEGLALYFYRRRVVGPASDPALAGLADRLIATGRALLAVADLLLDEAPFEALREYLGTAASVIDVDGNLESLKALFTLHVASPGDRSILRACRWLYIVVCELRSELPPSSSA